MDATTATTKATSAAKEPAGRPSILPLAGSQDGPALLRATACEKRRRFKSRAGGIVADAVNRAHNRQDCAPPDACVQVVEDHFHRGRMGNLVKARAKNQHAIDQQRNAYEEPDGNRTVSSHGPHQNITLSAMKTIATITAQNTGL